MNKNVDDYEPEFSVQTETIIEFLIFNVFKNKFDIQNFNLNLMLQD